MKLNIYDFNLDLVQNRQQIPLKFAFLKESDIDVYTNIMPFVLCKDYFNDVLVAQYNWKTKKDDYTFCIYGFSHDASRLQFDEDKVILGLNCNKQCLEYIKNNIHNIHAIEEKNGLEKTQLFEVENNKNYLICIADKFWQSSTALISLYTQLLRVCCYKEFNYKNEYNFQCLPFNYEKLFSHLNLLQRKDGNPYLATQLHSYDFIHSNLGFVSILRTCRNKGDFYYNQNEIYEVLNKKENTNEVSSLQPLLV